MGVPPIRKSENSTLKEAVSLRFILTQHLPDEELIRSTRGRAPGGSPLAGGSFITILGCGRYIPRPNRDFAEFVVERFSDLNLKIIPLFEKYKLYGAKRYDFEDFRKVAILMNKKSHLELSGALALNEIKKIKSNMNKLRTYTLNKI